MSVGRDEVLRIAELAKLRLDEGEADRLTAEMNRILAHAERLRGLEGGSSGAATPSGEVGGPDARPGPTPTEGPPDGGREADAGPDTLVRRPEDFAPEMADGFFLVPPPPGVAHDDDG